MGSEGKVTSSLAYVPLVNNHPSNVLCVFIYYRLNDFLRFKFVRELELPPTTLVSTCVCATHRIIDWVMYRNITNFRSLVVPIRWRT
jgi:hypothetical protein